MMEGVDSSMIYLIHYKNFCKCHNVPPPSTTMKKFFKGKCFKRNKEITFQERDILCTQVYKWKNKTAWNYSRNEGDKGGWWRGEFSYDIFDTLSLIHLIRCKNICKCHNILSPRTTIKK
jgi:hypothetical protein